MKIFDIENNYLLSWRNNFIAYATFCFLLTIFIGTVFLFTGLGQYNIPESIAVMDYNTIECETGLKNTKIFSLYGLRRSSVVKLTKTLCDDVRMKQRYSRIKGQWQHNNIHKLSMLLSPYNLLIAKPAYINTQDILASVNYLPLASYQTYPSYFINNSDEPIELTDKYFHNKKVGLLINHKSFSGFIIPKNALKHAGIDENLINFMYYKTHHDLRTALSKGEVDLIGSYLAGDYDSKINPKGSLLLKDGIESSTWYFIDTTEEIKCAIIEAISLQLKDENDPYFKNLTYHTQCKNQIL
jgi:hypothetical protein